MRNDQLFVRMGYIMGSVMLALGAFVAIKPADNLVEWFAANGGGVPANVVGGLLMAYGAFRIWRARVMHQRMRKS
jgi:hypothetical protein